MAEKKLKRIAVIRIKGQPGLKHDIKATFNKLRLYKKNNCVIISNTPSQVGMLEKIKNVATWGEIDEKTCNDLFEKRGKLPGNKRLTNEYAKDKAKTDIQGFTKEFISFKKEIKDIPGMKPFFKLNPPKKGFERKGIKVPFAQGGVLGYRKDKINNLLMRMI
jgi:large subunit ribosomal protein L30